MCGSVLLSVGGVRGYVLVLFVGGYSSFFIIFFFVSFVVVVAYSCVLFIIFFNACYMLLLLCTGHCNEMCYINKKDLPLPILVFEHNPDHRKKLS